MKYRSILIAAAVMLCCMIFVGCSYQHHGSTAESTVSNELIVQKINDYMNDKYGFTPEFRSIYPKKEVGGAESRIYTANCIYMLREFSVNADFSDPDNVYCSDTYQSDEISSDMEKWFSEQCPENKNVRFINSVGDMFYKYFHDYYDKTNLFDFLKGQYYTVYVLYTGHDVSDEAQYKFLDELTRNDIGYRCMFISCYTDNDVEKLKEREFLNEYDGVKFAPYIEEYYFVTANNGAEKNAEYYRMNIQEANGFLYSVMDDDFLKCGKAAEINSERTEELNELPGAASPCWHLTGPPANLRIYVPMDLIELQRDANAAADILPLERKVCGVFREKGKAVRKAAGVYAVGDYICFDLNSRSGEKNDTDVVMGVFDDRLYERITDF